GGRRDGARGAGARPDGRQRRRDRAPARSDRAMMRRFRHRPAALARRLAALLCLAIVASPGLAGGAPRVYGAPAAPRGGAAAPRDRVRPLIAHADALRAELRALLGREVLAAPVKVRIADIPAELDHLVPGGLDGPATAVSFGALRLAVLSATPRLGLAAPDLDR